MSADIRSYQAAEGLTDEQMAALLTDKLGRKISTAGYKVVRNRKGAPDEWLESLGIAPVEPTDSTMGNTDTPPDEPPDMNAATDRPPKQSPVALPLPFEPQTAQMQLTLLYQMAGRGASIALRSPQVAEVWNEHAPGIAAAYIEWARHNATVAHYISAITLGGPAGQLVLLHGSLIVSTLIVSGRVNPAQFIPPPRQAQETDLIGDEPPPDEGAPNGDENTAQPRAKRRRSSPVRGVE